MHASPRSKSFRASSRERDALPGVRHARRRHTERARSTRYRSGQGKHAAQYTYSADPPAMAISADRLTNEKIVEMVPVDRFANREARLPAAGGSIVFL